LAQTENIMAVRSESMIVEAERRFPCRIRLGVPPGGLGTALGEMHAWLEENCGADGWAMTPAGRRGGVDDALAVYFTAAASAAAFVARWCAGSQAEIECGAFVLRRDRPAPRSVARPHRTF